MEAANDLNRGYKTAFQCEKKTISFKPGLEDENRRVLNRLVLIFYLPN